jgi:exodeoxyribonuclease VIII
MTNAEYHSLPSISKSGLDLIHRAPALYRYRRANPTPQTPAMRWGTLVHTAILEPETMADTYVTAPAVDRRTKEGKAAYEAFLAEWGSKEVITADE